MIQFLEHNATGYLARTLFNIQKSDMTIAFAADFKTAGEVATFDLCNKCEKPYVAIDIKFFTVGNIELRKQIIGTIREYHVSSLNIAGNGLYTLSNKYTQEGIDKLIAYHLDLIVPHTDITTIRSGGQSGVDEAGLKYGDSVGLRTVCCAPKGWMFRNRAGQDVLDKEEFMDRFGEHYSLFY